MSNCIKCGKELHGLLINNMCPECYNREMNIPVGWKCPVCGRGNSPWTKTCPCIPLPQGTFMGDALDNLSDDLGVSHECIMDCEVVEESEMKDE